jgi:N-acetylglucosaminyl-diphospho-decaprenol L-rhamnosyltransferase
MTSAGDTSSLSAVAATVSTQQTAATSRRRRYAVIIVHYKTPQMLADCVATLLPELDAAQGDEVVVVDNASGADMVQALESLANVPLITLIKSPENLGFAGGNNVGLHHVLATGSADYFILLNADTLIRPSAFATLRSFLDTHSDVACVGPRLEYPDGTPQLSAFGDPTPLSELVRGANIGFVSRLLKRWEVYGQIKTKPHRADWVAGACVMMREEVIKRVGLLDDGYFMYFEEVDYFRRARKLGLYTWHEPAAHVVHLVGGSSGVTTDWSAKRLPDYWFESRHRYFRKHFGYLGMAAADLAWLVGHLLMRVRRLFTGVSHSAVAKSETRDLLRHSLKQLVRPASPPPRRAAA